MAENRKIESHKATKGKFKLLPAIIIIIFYVEKYTLYCRPPPVVDERRLEHTFKTARAPVMCRKNLIN